MGSRGAGGASRAVPRVRREHVLALMDRSYDVRAGDDAWVEGIASACALWLDDGEGVHAFRFDLGAGAVASPTLVGGDEAWREAWRETWWEGFMRRVPPDTLRAMAAFGPVSHTTELWAAMAAQIPTFEELLTRGGRRALRASGAAAAGMRYPESLNVTAADADGVGMALCANRSSVAARPLPAPTRWVVSRLVAHVTAGLRLRKRLGRRSLLDGAEAVVDTKGKMVHLEPRAEVARAALRHAAADVVRAKRQQGEDPSAVLALWRALYAGEYTVVEAFDTDGRRFVVARANRPEPRRVTSGPARRAEDEALSERDRRVLAMFGNGCANKLIAYQLAMSPSSVAASLARARRVLGASSSAELVSAARRLGVVGAAGGRTEREEEE